jgi:YjjG family noncanonical pyrimidine nucleotidase
MKYKWILFDADGTLFDYDSAEAFALKTTLEAFGQKATPTFFKMYASINSGLFRELERGRITLKELKTKRFKLLFNQLGFDIKEDDFSRRYIINLSGASQLLPGAVETVKALHSKCRMLLITNGISKVQRSRLNASELKRYINDAVISEEVGVAKPSIKIFDVAFKKMNMPVKKEVLIVGDSLGSDMTGGVNYGIDTCWYNPLGVKNDREFEVTYEIKDLREVTKLVE